MVNTLKIEIEADSEEGVFPILQHVFREITEQNSYNNPTNSDCVIDGAWLIVNENSLKGKYQWTRS